MSDVVGMFVGLGAMVLLLVVAYWFYQIARLYKDISDTSQMESVCYNTAYKNYAKKKGIDIDKELAKTKIMKGRDFHKEMRAKVIEEFLGKEGK